MDATTFIANTWAAISSTSLAFVSGFFESNMLEYLLWFVFIIALVSIIFLIGRKVVNGK